MEPDALIEWGGSVKALDETADAIKVGGYIVQFGTAKTADLSSHRDYFTKDTYYGLDLSTKGVMRWHHNLDPKVGMRRLGIAEAKADVDDVGVWAEGWAKLADDYDRKIAGWVKDKKVGWSTAALPHAVGRKSNPDGTHEITEWILGGGDWSLTMTPADPRQRAGGVSALKSIVLDAKGEFLGQDAETSAVVAAVERLTSRLMSRLYELGYRDATGRTLAQKVADLPGAFDELKDTSLRLVAALLPAGDGTKSLAEWGPGAGSTFIESLGRSGADLRRIVAEAKKRVENRKTEGRDVPADLTASMKSLHASLGEILSLIAPTADPAVFERMSARLERFKR